MPLVADTKARAGAGSGAGAAWLLLAAVAIRVWFWGNPVIHSDEQFYLLVGDRMLDGAWPFVDIFDRKPVGLFLIFAALAAVGRAIGGGGVMAYQVAATLVAAFTAWLVMRLAHRLTGVGPGAALGAGLCYLVWLVVFDGAGGQSAVWGNAAMAAAALLVTRAIGTPARVARNITWQGAGAMLLVGIAMQIKYTALFEGVAFGCALLHASRSAGRSLPRVATDGALWIAAALLPTATALIVYVAAGHGGEFVFANFVSIMGQRDDDAAASDLLKIAVAIALSAPLLWLAWRGRTSNRPALMWAGVAVAAVAIMGRWELFYLQPVALPLSVAAAAGLERAGRPDRRRLLAVLAIGVVLAAGLSAGRIARRGDAAQVARLVRLIGQRPPGCLFVFGSEPILYHLTDTCLPTRFLFRSHLSKSIEAGGTGVDQVAEVRRVLAQAPGVVVVRDPRGSTDPATYRLVADAVRARYRPVGGVTIGGVAHRVFRLREPHG